jgi:hypothetical protein
MMLKKARDLSRGDVFSLHVYGEVVAAEPIAGGKRIKVVLTLENQGRRDNCGGLVDRPPRGDELEFTDDGYTIEFSAVPAGRFT